MAGTTVDTLLQEQAMIMQEIAKKGKHPARTYKRQSWRGIPPVKEQEEKYPLVNKIVTKLNKQINDTMRVADEKVTKVASGLISVAHWKGSRNKFKLPLANKAGESIQGHEYMPSANINKLVSLRLLSKLEGTPTEKSILFLFDVAFGSDVSNEEDMNTRQFAVNILKDLTSTQDGRQKVVNLSTAESDLLACLSNKSTQLDACSLVLNLSTPVAENRGPIKRLVSFQIIPALFDIIKVSNDQVRAVCFCILFNLSHGNPQVKAQIMNDHDYLDIIRRTLDQENPEPSKELMLTTLWLIRSLAETDRYENGSVSNESIEKTRERREILAQYYFHTAVLKYLRSDAPVGTLEAVLTTLLALTRAKNAMCECCFAGLSDTVQRLQLSHKIKFSNARTRIGDLLEAMAKAIDWQLSGKVVKYSPNRQRKKTNSEQSQNDNAEQAGEPTQQTGLSVAIPTSQKALKTCKSTTDVPADTNIVKEENCKSKSMEDMATMAKKQRPPASPLPEHRRPAKVLGDKIKIWLEGQHIKASVENTTPTKSAHPPAFDLLKNVENQDKDSQIIVKYLDKKEGAEYVRRKISLENGTTWI
eukprot:m.46873 g.46873  ORF g.46873 m.46873 type:complete len:587 (-) comp10423_c0_seq1:161-1921(-)